MILNKLIGYDPITLQYTNPDTGDVENLPSANFLISNSLIEGYEDFGSIENWYKYGFSLIGSNFGYRDYQSWRIEIRILVEEIAGVDYSSWDSLNTLEKIIALRLVPTKIIDARGFDFFAGNVLSLIGNGDSIMSIINNYLDRSAEARSLRYDSMVKFAYQYLGKNQGLKAELLARQSFTDMVYIERGVLYKSEDDTDGFGDWILSTIGTSFEATGLKALLSGGTFVLGGGIDIDTFTSSMIQIVENGMY